MWNGPFYKNMFCGGLFFASRAPLIHFEWIQKLSNPPHFVHGERWCVQKNPTLKHLAKGHFFGDTLYSHFHFLSRKCTGTLQPWQDVPKMWQLNLKKWDIFKWMFIFRCVMTCDLVLLLHCSMSPRAIGWLPPSLPPSNIKLPLT